MRFGLDRMHRLMAVLGMPQRRFASIHVVGTNGKSSTVRMIAAILAEHGLRAGAYTSPHLRSFAERIEVDGAALDDAEFASAVGEAARAAELVNRTAAEDDRVTQFEALTAAAFHALARARVEVAVVEAGLGGRYDATNVIPSKVQVLTGVGLDHVRWLGPGVADIAEEKLAVVGDHATLVTGPLAPDVERVAARAAAARSARRVYAADPSEVPELRARGSYQRQNFALARSAAEAFLGELDEDAVRRAASGLELPGRMQVTGEAPLTVLDGAHNRPGAAAVAAALPELVGARPLTGVFAMLDDKDAAGMLAELLPLCQGAVYTRCQHPRTLAPATLETLGAKLAAVPSQIVPDADHAVQQARLAAGAGGAVLVTGSIYLIADLVRPASAVGASTL